MRHLHNMHILHRDLKIQNILLKSSNKDSRCFTVKVSDFGLAKVWDGRARGTSPTEKQKYAGAIFASFSLKKASLHFPPFPFFSTFSSGHYHRI
jgi:serine/threonine protein kinase